MTTRAERNQIAPSRLMRNLGLLIAGLGLVLLAVSWILGWVVGVTDTAPGSGLGIALGLVAGIWLSISGVITLLAAPVFGRFLDGK